MASLRKAWEHRHELGEAFWGYVARAATPRLAAGGVCEGGNSRNDRHGSAQGRTTAHRTLRDQEREAGPAVAGGLRALRTRVMIGGVRSPSWIASAGLLLILPGCASASTDARVTAGLGVAPGAKTAPGPWICRKRSLRASRRGS